MVFLSPPQYMHENSDPPPLDHYTFLGNCPHTPPQRPTLCPKWEVCVNVDLGKGKQCSFPKTYNDLPLIFPVLLPPGTLRYKGSINAWEGWLKKIGSVYVSRKLSTKTLSSHLSVELDSINGALSLTWTAAMKTESFCSTKEFNSHLTGSGVMWKRYIEKDKARNSLQ